MHHFQRVRKYTCKYIICIMHIYIYIYIYIYKEYICACMHHFQRVRKYTCKYIICIMHIYIYIYTYIYIKNTYVHACITSRGLGNIHANISYVLCIYIYIYIYTYIYIYKEYICACMHHFQRVRKYTRKYIICIMHK